MTVFYLVKGRTGQYEDTIKWDVCGYSSKKRAEEHRVLAQTEANKAFEEFDYDVVVGSDEWMKFQESNPYDKNMNLDYEYEVIYTVEEVEWGG